MGRTAKRHQEGKTLLLQRHGFHPLVMFLVALMPLTASGRVKTLICNPDHWRENYSCKILKSQLKAFSKNILLDTKKSLKDCIYNITLLFPFNCTYLQNWEEHDCLRCGCTKFWQMVQTCDCYPGADLSSFLLKSAESPGLAAAQVWNLAN